MELELCQRGGGWASIRSRQLLVSKAKQLLADQGREN
jgi:hypothetical protein